MQTQATFTDDDSEYDSLPSLMIRGSNESLSSDDTVSVELPSTNWINNGPASVPEAIDVFQCDLALTHDEVSIPSTHLRTSEGVPLTASEGRRLAINRDAEEDLATHDVVASYANLLLSIEQGIRPSCLNSQYSIMAIDFELNMRNATATDETERAKLEKSDWEQFGYDAALSRMKSSLREQIRAYRYYKSSTCQLSGITYHEPYWCIHKEKSGTGSYEIPIEDNDASLPDELFPVICKYGIQAVLGVDDETLLSFFKEETKKVLGFKRVPFCLELNKEGESIQMGPKKCIDFACTNHPKAEDNTSKPIRFSQAGMVVPTLPNIFPDLPLVRLENGELTTTRTAFAGGIAIIGESGLCA